jgi:hypothetical protein
MTIFAFLTTNGVNGVVADQCRMGDASEKASQLLSVVLAQLTQWFLCT